VEWRKLHLRFLRSAHGSALAANKVWNEKHKPSPLPKTLSWLMTYFFHVLRLDILPLSQLCVGSNNSAQTHGHAAGGIVWLYLPLFMLLPLVASAHFLGNVACHETRTDPC
jgi:hypothetical protein